MKVYFFTLGCRVNQYETDAVREMFIEKGHEIAKSPEEADVCIVNTCTVTGEADRKSRQMLRKMARLNPDTVVCAMGCAAEMTGGMIDADIICGTRDKNILVEKVESFVAEKSLSALTHCSMHMRPEVSRSDVYHDFGSVLSPEGTRAFMKIEDGCNMFCTYCIIPFARGRVASREEESIIKEAVFLVEKGFKEIIISGIHLCSYGKDRGEDISAMLRVIKRIDSIPGIERIRLGSMEPMSMTKEFIEGLSDIEHLCPHFHLSLQSGCDSVLKRMGRHYNTEQYLERVKLLREHFESMSLTTDIICGFPGETDEEFNATKDFVARAGFNKIHVFPYSVREGTVAAKMEQLPAGLGKERAKELISWSDEAEKLFAQSFTGKKTKVLLETMKKDKDGRIYYTGYTPEYVKAEVLIDDAADPASFKGRIVEIEIKYCEGNMVIG